MAIQLKAAQAGTVESCDILIQLAPAEPGNGIQIELVSPTIQQYGEHIRKLITEILRLHGIENAVVYANDKGALDYTIKARLKSVIQRASS